MRIQDYEVCVLPKGRAQADEYQHRGETWIEGRYNSWYQIELQNHTNQRVMAILTVDGVGVVDGQPGSFDSPGFVLEPRQKLSVPGWVRSNQEAARFEFGRLDKSYADQTGQGGNQGIIGVAWFPEKKLTPHVYTLPGPRRYYPLAGTSITSVPVKGTLHRDWYQTLSSNSGDTLIGSNSSQQLYSASMGTAWGEDTQFGTTRTNFEKASSQPDAVLCLRYDSAQALQRMGIRLRERSRSSDKAFPGNSTGYCAPPPTWANKKAFR